MPKIELFKQINQDNTFLNPRMSLFLALCFMLSYPASYAQLKTPSPDSLKEPVKKKPVSKGPLKEEETKGKNNILNKSPVKKPSHNILVPPPPPSIPTANMDSMYSINDFIEYMSLQDLTSLSHKLEKDLTSAREGLNELKSLRDEKTQKDSDLEELFQEGVISRHELDNMRKETIKLNQDYQDAKEKVQTLEERSNRINKRLHNTKPTTKNGAKSPIPKPSERSETQSNEVRSAEPNK